MFEFHGWAVVSYHAYETAELPTEDLWARFLDYLHREVAPYHNAWLTTRINGSDSFVITGLFNHRQEWVIDIFRWLAANASGAYGLLYVRDDEDCNRGDNFANVFRVWRLARSELVEVNDLFLSPCVPTVEDPYDPDYLDLE
jgi:hypothetical protein